MEKQNLDNKIDKQVEKMQVNETKVNPPEATKDSDKRPSHGLRSHDHRNTNRGPRRPQGHSHWTSLQTSLRKSVRKLNKLRLS
jgi:hypothetical protein